MQRLGKPAVDQGRYVLPAANNFHRPVSDFPTTMSQT
jgi:hypothetical protein